MLVSTPLTGVEAFLEEAIFGEAIFGVAIFGVAIFGGVIVKAMMLNRAIFNEVIFVPLRALAGFPLLAAFITELGTTTAS